MLPIPLAPKIAISMACSSSLTGVFDHAGLCVRSRDMTEISDFVWGQARNASGTFFFRFTFCCSTTSEAKADLVNLRIRRWTLSHC
jgi:hypothetical protein